MDIGVRELKARLSEVMGRVERGEVVVVTNRGRRIAHIVPAGPADAIGRGIREGWLTRRSEAPPTAVVRQEPRHGTLDTTESIRRDRDA
jgi:prevent-host-death family protein